MKAIMYHYIRNKSKEFSNLNILKKGIFKTNKFIWLQQFN